MARWTFLLALLGLGLLAHAQYPFNRPEPVDTTEVDSTLRVPVAIPVSPDEGLRQQAVTWVRRLMYRGFLDDETTGVSATYALTDWSEASGPHGPVKAHVTVSYLGAVVWLGKPATWLQATYRSFEPSRPSVDFDLVVARGEKLGEVYRALSRVNKGELAATNFNLPEGQLDMDRADQPPAKDRAELQLYAGTFSVSLHQGSGTDGSKVIAYRTSELPPLSLVRLAYGSECLSLRDRGVDVSPKFEVPLPTVR